MGYIREDIVLFKRFGVKAHCDNSGHWWHECPKCGGKIRMYYGGILNLFYGGGHFKCKKCDWHQTFNELKNEGGHVTYLPSVFNDNYERNLTIATKKGIFVQSIGERDITNYLFEHKIDYEYDKKLTFETNGQKKYGHNDLWLRPDFYLTEFNIVIEYWGMKGQLDYDAKTEEKKQVYMETKTPFISIDRSDLNNLEELLTVKLARLGVNL